MQRAPVAVAALLALSWFSVAPAHAEPHGSRRAGKRRPHRPAPVPVETPVDEAPLPVAEPPPPPPPPPLPVYAPTPATEKPLVTVAVDPDDLPEPAPTDVLAGFASVLQKSAQVRYRDPWTLLTPSAGEVSAALARADLDMEHAGKAFDEMNLDVAASHAGDAIALYERHLPALAARDGNRDRLRDAHSRLASIRFFEGDNDGAGAALGRVFVLDPALTFSAERFPPQMKDLVDEAQAAAAARGAGRLAVTSEPAGATIYLDGVEKGRAPLTIEGVPGGPAHVHAARKGRAPADNLVDHPGGDAEVKVDLRFAAIDDDPFATLRRAEADLGRAEIPEPVLQAAGRFAVDVLAVVRLSRRGDQEVVLSGFLYDQRSRQLLRKATRAGAPDQLGEAGRQLANSLFTRVPLDGKPHSQRPDLSASIRENWAAFRGSTAFWPTLGVVAGAVVGGVAVGVGVGTTRMSAAEQVVLWGGAGTPP